MARPDSPITRRARSGPAPRLAAFSAFVSLLAGCADVVSERTGSETQPIIYGSDDRVEIFELEAEDPAAVAARSVAAMVRRRRLRAEGDAYTVDGPTWAEDQALCEGVRFAEQTVVADCGGVLVAPDLIWTAGHCARLCSLSSIVFGLHYQAPGDLGAVDASQIYECVEVVVDEVSPTGVDYAFLRLDRPVEGRAPVPLAPSPTLGDPLTLLSFPAGLPMKADAGGLVTGLREGGFLTSHDAFRGSSGGALLDAQGRVAGVLGGGAPDLVATDAGCHEPLVVAAGPFEGSERATSAPTALAGLCDADPCAEPCDSEATCARLSSGCSAATHPDARSWIVWCASLVVAGGAIRRRRCDRQ